MKFTINLKWISFFLLLSTFIYSQELPPIKIFSVEDYSGANQNWSISQAPNKFIYVANNDGLLEYNGAKWTLYPSPNNTIMRAVNVIDNKIYTGCYMEFGYWTKDANGKLQYQSLIPKLEVLMIDDEHVWNIIDYDEWVLFQSKDRIYFYNTITQKFSILDSKNTIIRVYNIGNMIYYNVTNEGLYKIENGKSKLIVKEPIYENEKIVNVFPKEDGLLIQTRKSGFYTLQSNMLSRWEIPATKSLEKMTVFTSIQLNDKGFVIGTISDGVVLMDKNGNISYHINQVNGLSNNTALSLFEDMNENLWVGLDNGINCINIKSPIRVFRDDKGVLGSVYSSIKFENYTYLGTNQGLFYREKSKNVPFQFIQGTAGQVWSLFAYDSKLFCGHHEGTFIVEEEKVVLISDIPGTWNFSVIENTNNSLLQGNYDGLHILVKENEKWKWKNKIKGFDTSARYIDLNKKNEIWISHEYKGVFQLKVDKGFNEVTELVKIPELPFGKNAGMVKFKNELLYAFDDGVYKKKSNENTFVRDEILSQLVLNGHYLSGKLITDNTEKLWAFTEENINYVLVNNLTNKYKLHEIDIPSNLIKGVVGFENISHLEKERYLIGTSYGYISLNLSNINRNDSYHLFLNSISIKKPGSSDLNISLTEFSAFPYDRNSIVFNYSVPNYDKFHITEYQYKLEGDYNDWSDWITDSEIEFKNLSFGDYILKIRAKVGGRMTENIIDYSFKVNRPWYLSNLAIVVYVLIILMLIFIIHRSYKKYYHDAHEHKQLENKQLIMKINNEKLTQDIDNKNRELAISTMSTIKRNEMLGNIKKELMDVDGESNKISSVIRLINKNLNNTKDWKFFEEAFNNADKHFLDKVKKAHPNLSPNDLRFCAYLRLNLSSKEIAPLLNISVRSVETKRYRLRKQLNLSHNESLIGHILEI